MKVTAEQIISTVAPFEHLIEKLPWIKVRRIVQDHYDAIERELIAEAFKEASLMSERNGGVK